MEYRQLNNYDSRNKNYAFIQSFHIGKYETMRFFNILVIILIIGCKVDSNNSNIIIEKSTSHPTFNSYIEHDDLRFSDYYDPISTISLDNKAPTIGEINKILQRNKYLYILDQSGAQQLFVFDTTGKFISTVGKKGLGPDEHEYIEDFGVNEKYIVICTSNKALLWYSIPSFSLEYITPLPIYPEAIMPLGSNGWLISTNSLDENPHKSHLLALDSAGKVVEGFIPIEDKTLAGISANRIFSDQQSTPFYAPTRGKILYSIVNKAAIPWIDMQAAAKRWTGQRLSNFTRIATGDIMIHPQFTSFYMDVSSQEENAKEKLYWNYVDKTTGEWHSFDGITVDWLPLAIEGHPKAIMYDSLLVWPIYADGIEAFLELIKEDKDYQIKLMENDPIAASIIKNHREQNNPTLLIGRWKK